MEDGIKSMKRTVGLHCLMFLLKSQRKTVFIARDRIKGKQSSNVQGHVCRHLMHATVPSFCHLLLSVVFLFLYTMFTSPFTSQRNTHTEKKKSPTVSIYRISDSPLVKSLLLPNRHSITSAPRASHDQTLKVESYLEPTSLKTPHLLSKCPRARDLRAESF